MLQTFLRDRFRLAQHRETGDAPVCLLTTGKNGAKMHEGGQVRLNRSVQIGASGKPDWSDFHGSAGLAGLRVKN